ncbi:hypothetical protein ACMA1I_01020 [Pontibacter sp. 13R65]|uniref:hypothetical protein n=1 Tax=Pontibacter sp. 13R65 TaxID=3127458 RepID=UPI00301E38D5
MKLVAPTLTAALLIFITILFTNCSTDPKYQVTNYYPTQQQQDTLKANLITYVGVPPKNVSGLNRFKPIYRKHYISFLPKYELDRYYIADDSTHYFFMVRPARSAKGPVQRGVGGRFRKNSRGRIIDFEELYNTPILEAEEIREKGRALFSEMVKTGSIESYADNRAFVEWPDDRLKYSKATYEWRYVPYQQIPN